MMKTYDNVTVDVAPGSVSWGCTYTTTTYRLSRWDAFKLAFLLVFSALRRRRV